MATIYTAHCRDCGHQFDLMRGPLMLAAPYVCTTCGDAVMIPGTAPKDAAEMDRAALLRYVADGPDDLDGRTFTPKEKVELSAIRDHCGCGGRRLIDMDDDTVQRRCLRCRSTRLQLELDVLAD